MAIDLTATELAEFPNILALARMNIGAQLANGVKDEGGRVVALLAVISSIEVKLMQQAPDVLPSKRKRINGKEARA